MITLLTPFSCPLPCTIQAKYLSVEFKALDEDEKAKWDSLAQKDKDRYQREMESYVPPSDDSDSDSDTGGRKKKKKQKKDPNAPKRNQSAFFLYSNATRAQVREANPDLAFGQVAQEISKNFKALPDEEREYWNEKAAADKERYQREMAAYKGE
jgi:isopenicillin N synthase-like dioxygenase